MQQSTICKLEIQRAHGIIHSEAEGLGTRGAYDVTSSPRAIEDERRPSSISKRGKKNKISSFLCLLFFFSGPQWTG